jgi:hypothetical protein
LHKFFNNNNCLATEQLGDECSEDAQCAAMDPLAKCIKVTIASIKTCECDKDHYVNDPLSEKCLPGKNREFNFNGAQNF